MVVSRTITILNVAPSVTQLSSTSNSIVEMNQLIPIAGAVTDESSDDRDNLQARLRITNTTTGEVERIPVSLSTETSLLSLESEGSTPVTDMTFTTRYAFAQSGDYSVQVEVFDDDGGRTVGTETLTFQVPGVALSDSVIADDVFGGWSLASGSATLAHPALGGNPGGFLRFSESVDVDSGFELQAPAEITDKLGSAEGQYLAFDAILLTGDVAGGQWGSVQIEGNGMVARSKISQNPSDQWRRYFVPLVESYWLDSEGQEISSEDWAAILSDATVLRLSFDADTESIDQTGLDNFAIVESVVNDFDAVESGVDNYQLTFDELVGVDLAASATVRIDWGDETPLTDLNVDPLSDLIGQQFTHTFEDNGEYEIVVSMSDGGGFIEMGRHRVLVDNGIPTASVSAPVVVNEGDAAQIELLGGDDPSSRDAASLRYSFDFDGDGSFDGSDDIRSVSTPTVDVPQHLLQDDVTRTVIARVEDKDGGFSDYSIELTVNNVRPVVDAGADVNAVVGVPLNHEITFTDPGADQPWTVRVDWNGDGNFDDAEDQVFVTNERSVDLQYVFDASVADTVVNVGVEVSDGDGGISLIDAFAVNVTNPELAVASFTPHISGFDIVFNRTIDSAELNLYDTLLDDAALSPADITVTDGLDNVVNGSIAFDEATRTLRFIRSGAPLEDDTYSVTLRSASIRSLPT